MSNIRELKALLRSGMSSLDLESLTDETREFLMTSSPSLPEDQFIALTEITQNQLRNDSNRDSETPRPKLRVPLVSTPQTIALGSRKRRRGTEAADDLRLDKRVAAYSLRSHFRLLLAEPAVDNPLTSLPLRATERFFASFTGVAVAIGMPTAPNHADSSSYLTAEEIRSFPQKMLAIANGELTMMDHMGSLYGRMVFAQLMPGTAHTAVGVLAEELVQMKTRSKASIYAHGRDADAAFVLFLLENGQGSLAADAIFCARPSLINEDIRTSIGGISEHKIALSQAAASNLLWMTSNLLYTKNVPFAHKKRVFGCVAAVLADTLFAYRSELRSRFLKEVVEGVFRLMQADETDHPAIEGFVLGLIEAIEIRHNERAEREHTTRITKANMYITLALLPLNAVPVVGGFISGALTALITSAVALRSETPGAINDARTLDSEALYGMEHDPDRLNVTFERCRSIATSCGISDPVTIGHFGPLSSEE